ncbi:MAG TPA: hypothetical protein VLH08_06235, partial [Acidobacteriota bacterium]|nr:hypothetical protein [Acidobacteriota bacterium]
MEFKKDSLLLNIFGVLLLGISGYVYWDYYQPDWKFYQSDFRALVAEKFGEERASKIPKGLQQIWVKELNKVERCTTCHQGIQWKGLENADHPFRTHPQEILKEHPIEKFGCVSCHGGQGYATNVQEAHGFTEHWENPLLGKELSELYLVRDKKAMMQMNCNSCHRFDRETKGADS